MPKSDHIPTPPLGTTVHFFVGCLPCGPEEEAEYVATNRLQAAVVIGWNDKPGEVRLLAYDRNGSPKLHRIVPWSGSEQAQQVPLHHNVQNAGTWAYLHHDDSRKYQAWQKREAENRLRREKEQEDQRRAEEAKRQRLAELQLLGAKR